MERKILFVCDDNYVYPLVISIGAIGFLNLGETEIVLVNIPNWTPEAALIQESNIRLIEKVCLTFGLRFQLVEIDLENQDMVGTRSTYGHIPGTAWAKVIALFQMEVELGSKILYLDPDTLALDGYEEVFSLESFSPLGITARPTPGHSMFEEEWGLRFFHETGMSPQSRQDWYFNSGVMKLELRKLQSFNHWVDWRELLKNNSANKLVLQDQDFLNAITIGRIDKLNQRFNCYPSDYSIEETRILHFAGGYKPWHYRNPLSRLPINQNARKAMRIWRESESEIMEKLNLNWQTKDFEILLHHKRSVDKGFAFALSKNFPSIANSSIVSRLLTRMQRRL